MTSADVCHPLVVRLVAEQLQPVEVVAVAEVLQRVALVEQRLQERALLPSDLVQEPGQELVQAPQQPVPARLRELPSPVRRHH